MPNRQLVLRVSCVVAALAALPAAARAGCYPSSIDDNAYNGTLTYPSMACCEYHQPVPGIVQDVNVSMAVTHTYIGDLVIKLVSPANTIVTLQSRAGVAESADNGNDTMGFGDDSNWSGATIVYDPQQGGPSAETMGSSLGGTQSVCTDDAVCSHTPNAGSATLGGLDSFVGQTYSGIWQLCIGDAGGGDVGTWVGGDLQIAFHRRIPCACGGKFRGGDRVVYAPFAGPGTAQFEGTSSPPANGAKGEVMCGLDDGSNILVSWTGYADGHDGFGFCDCPTGRLPPLATSGYYVSCAELLFDLPWSDDFESGDRTHWSVTVPAE